MVGHAGNSGPAGGSAGTDRIGTDHAGRKYRIVFVLRDIEGLSIRETAESLELTEAAVKVRLLRARLMMREQLTRAFGDESTRLYPDHAHG